MDKLNNYKKHYPKKEDIDLLIKLFNKRAFEEVAQRVVILQKQYPNSPELFQIQGDVSFKLKNYSLALKSYDLAISHDRKNLMVHYNIGKTKYELGDWKGSIESYKKALPLISLKDKIYNNIGTVFNKLGETENAIKYFRLASKFNPTSADIFFNLGNAYKLLGKWENSKSAYLTAIKHNVGHWQALNNLGNVFVETEEIDKAKKCFLKSVKLNPSNSETYVTLGLIQFKKQDFISAEKSFGKALQLNPESIDGLIGLGQVNHELGLFKDALELFRKASFIDKSNQISKYNESQILLKELNFIEGWQKYDSRWKIKPLSKIKWPIQNITLWKGQKNSNVILWREQGVGDDIFFSALLHEALKNSDSLSVYVNSRLLSLFQRSMPEITFVTLEEAIKQKENYQYQLPLGSLPKIFRNSYNDFSKTRKGYLKTDRKRTLALRKELGINKKKVIGISWKSFNSNNAIKKNLELKSIMNILSKENAFILNLQYGDVHEEISKFNQNNSVKVHTCHSVNNKDDLDGLASLIDLCDLIVSTSNITIHLSGALNKKTWVLLPYVTEFWWFLDRSDSPWYPSLKLYRQKSVGSWTEPLSELEHDFDEWLLDKTV